MNSPLGPKPRSLAVLVLCLWSVAPLWAAPARTTPRPTRTPGAVDSAATGRGPLAPRRTLQDIRIEGEIAVPQVLFITARDQRRFLVSRHRAYLRDARALGADTPLPDRVTIGAVAVVPAAGVDPR